MYMLYKDDQFQINYRTRNVSAYLLALASGLQYLPSVDGPTKTIDSNQIKSYRLISKLDRLQFRPRRPFPARQSSRASNWCPLTTRRPRWEAAADVRRWPGGFCWFESSSSMSSTATLRLSEWDKWELRLRRLRRWRRRKGTLALKTFLKFFVFLSFNCCSKN